MHFRQYGLLKHSFSFWYWTCKKVLKMTPITMISLAILKMWLIFRLGLFVIIWKINLFLQNCLTINTKWCCWDYKTAIFSFGNIISMLVSYTIFVPLSPSQCFGVDIFFIVYAFPNLVALIQLDFVHFCLLQAESTN